MRKLLRWVVFVPLAIVLVLLAVANRAPVRISLDPFSADTPALAFTLPLFIALLFAVMVGVVIGGVVVGIGRMRWRYRAKKAEREAGKLSAENDAFLHSVASRERETEATSRDLALRQ
jgi:uncharacterized integral membrane protein